MKKKKERDFGFVKALMSFLIFSAIIIGVSLQFVYSALWIGLSFIGIGLFSLVFLWIFGIKPKAVYPDIIFGAIDNGVLVFAAVWGGNIAGVAGAIIGGAAGNTITDGIGGLFEGHIADHQQRYKIDNRRTALSTSLGKMCGCLLGAGMALIFVALTLKIAPSSGLFG